MDIILEIILGFGRKALSLSSQARAPLIIRAPGKAGNGQVCRRVVEFIDVYPSFLLLQK